MQIYNEKIFDLMQDKRRQNPLQLRDNHKDSNNSNNKEREKEVEGAAKSSGTVHVRGMSVYRIYSREEAIQLLKQGMRNRAIRATDFNSESSRSHTILQLFVTVEEEDDQGLMLLKRSTFSLVDLAGSEKWRSSLSTSTTNLQAEAAVQAQMKEMTNINTSLHVLGNCVSALIEPNRRHVPYRDSVLTRLLQDPLGGNGRTILIATIHADAGHKEETYSTLQFASRASRIKVALTVNVGINERANLVEAQKQIKMLRARLQEFQQGALSSRSRDGSVSPSGRKQLENTPNSSNTSGPCQQCQQNDKLIAALRAKIVELHNENQVLRGVTGGPHLSDPHHHSHHPGGPLPFRAPRKPLPAGGTTSTLTKMSPSPMLLHGHGDTSSLSSIDSVQVKKKKKASTGGKKLKRTGSKSGSRASSASGSRTREDTSAENEGGGEEEEEETEHTETHQTVGASPLPMGISALDPSANLNSNADGSVEEDGVRRSSASLGKETATASSSFDVIAPQEEVPLIPSPKVSPTSPTRSPPKQAHAAAEATPNKNSTESARSGGADSESSKRTSGANSLRFSDSSIEKVLKAANMVLNAPPASSLGLLSLMGELDGVASQPSTFEKEKIKKLKKKAKPAAIEASPQKEYGERVDVSSPSPPRNGGTVSHPSTVIKSPTKVKQKSSSMASPFERNNEVSQLEDHHHSGTSSVSNSFDSANLRDSMADYLEPSTWGNMMSPPVRKAQQNKFDEYAGTSYTSNSTASLGSLVGNSHGVGFGFGEDTPIGAYAAAPRKEMSDATSSAGQRGEPSTKSSSAPVNVATSALDASASLITNAPLPVLTPARRAIQKASNPDACAKHGLDQCVLCRMFGEENDDALGGSTQATNSYGASSYTSSYAQPVSSFSDNNSAYNPYQNSVYNAPYGQESQQQTEPQPVQKVRTEKKRSSQQQSNVPTPSDYSYQQQHYGNMGSNYSSEVYSDVVSNFTPPQQLQIPAMAPIYEQKQQHQWQNQSSDFSPSGIYSNALNVVEKKQHKTQRKAPSVQPQQNLQQHQNQQQQSSYFQASNTFVPDSSPCKQHGITDCLMCTMNSGAAPSSFQLSSSQFEQQSYTMYPLNDQLDNYTSTLSAHGGFQPPFNHNTAVGVNAHIMSSAPPLRFAAPQEYISTVDSSDQLDGYGFQNSSNSPAPSMRSLSGTSANNRSKGEGVDLHRSSRHHQQGPMGGGGGSSSAPILGLHHQENMPSQTHLQHHHHHQDQVQQGAQVRNIKHISQQRHQQSQYSSADQSHGNSNITYVGYPAGSAYEQSYGGTPDVNQYQQQQYSAHQLEQQSQPQRSVYGNSVQTVQALRQNGSNFTAMHPRSTSSPLPRGQPSSILPSILNEYEYHNNGNQYDTASAQKTQQQNSHSGHTGGGKGNITYLDDDGEVGDEPGEENDSDDDNFQPHVPQADGRSNSQEPVGRAVIKKKKKVKKKVTRKVQPTSSAGIVAVGAKKKA